MIPLITLIIFTERLCDPLDIPDHAQISTTNRNIGTTVQFTCDQYFLPDSTEGRECLSSGIWSGKNTQCYGTYNLNNAIIYTSKVVIVIRMLYKLQTPVQCTYNTNNYYPSISE